ncbi:MAG: DUF4153 domain-containing protein, partial [Gammaproteobacteria bacterium]|nr:DUF4153 domain-containing protein [Gammaproteobacteria bacterium]
IGFMGHTWKSVDSRLAYIRFLGEVLIYSVIILLGGMILTGLTLGLFSLIDLKIHNFYTEYIVDLGLVSSPVVATYLYDNLLGRESKISTLISNVFSPLFLVTVIVYLLAVLYQGKSPYLDREFLIIFNGLLIVVWGIAVFSISGIDNFSRGNLPDKINIALVSVTLIINAIALSAIIFRLTEYGVTPNRIAVTGANLLIFIHLGLILKAYLSYIKVPHSYKNLKAVISNYLPVYSVWSLFIVVALPLIFWFE